jgi:uncharacterized membrane protein (DUF485 family)
LIWLKKDTPQGKEVHASEGFGNIYREANKRESESTLPLANIIGISMISGGLILAGIVIWRAAVYRRLDKEARKPLDD